jgi:hypothetical protein
LRPEVNGHRSSRVLVLEWPFSTTEDEIEDESDGRSAHLDPAALGAYPIDVRIKKRKALAETQEQHKMAKSFQAFFAFLRLCGFA